MYCLFKNLCFTHFALQNYNKFFKYASILTIKCKFIYILVEKCLLFANLCDSSFEGFPLG